jgi:hypothetical protein
VQLLPACVLAPAPPLRLCLAPGAPPATAALLKGWAALSAEGTPVAFLARPASSAGDGAPQLALWHSGGAFHASRLPSSGEAARAFYPAAFAHASALHSDDEAAMPSDADALAAMRAFAELPVLRGAGDVEAVVRGWDAPRARTAALHRTTAAAADAGASPAVAAAACYARAKWDAMQPATGDDEEAAFMLAGAPAEDAALAAAPQPASGLASRPAFAPRTLCGALGEGVGGVAARVRYDVALRLRYPPDGTAPPARPKHRSQKAKAGGGGKEAVDAAAGAQGGAKARAVKRPRDADEVTSGAHGGEPRRARRSLAGALPQAPRPRAPPPPVAAPRPPAATILYPAQRRRADGRLLLERATAAAGAAGGAAAAPAKPAKPAAPSTAVASAQPTSTSKATVPASASKAAVPALPAAGASRVNRFLRIPTAALPPALQAALASDGVAPLAPAPPAASPVQAPLSCPTADCDMAPPGDPRARFCMGCGAMLTRPGA